MKRGKAAVREHGQALILIVLAVAGLLGLTALAVDGSHAFAQRRQAQNAADTAAFAAAVGCLNSAPSGGDCTTTTGAMATAALGRAGSNNFADSHAPADAGENIGQSIDVIVQYPPDDDQAHPIDATHLVAVTGHNGRLAAPLAYQGDYGYVQVKIIAHIPTFFAKIVGVSSLPIYVEAVAKAKPAHTVSIGGDNGIVALGNVCDAVRTHGSGHTTLTGGGVYSNSGAPTNPSGGNCYAFNAKGTGDQITTDSATMVGCLDPDDVTDGKINFPPGGTYTCGGAPIYYPPPPPDLGFDCSDLPVGTRSGSTIHPGRWSQALGNLGGNNIFPPTSGPAVDTIETGIYCITGHFNIGSSDTVSSTGGVTFILDGDLRWNAQATINFIPSNTGTVTGLLIYRPLNNSSTGQCDDGSAPPCQTLEFNGGASSNWSGTIYAPDSNCDINGESGSFTPNAQAICYVVDIGGTSDWSMTYNGADNWEFPYPPETELNR